MRVKTRLRQQGLQFDPLIKAQRAVFAGPLLLYLPRAANPVGQMTHPDDIGIRRVIALDHREIREDHKGRALRACGQQDRRGPVIRHRVAIQRGHAKVGPFRRGLGHLTVGQQIVKPLGQGHFDPPRLARRPAEMLEICRGRGQRIAGVVAPNVPPPVTVPIDGMGVEGRRHELRMPHRTRPRAAQLLCIGIARLQNTQSVQQFALEKLRPPRVIGEGGQRIQHAVAAPETAVGAL